MISLDLSLMTTTDIAEVVLSLGSNHQSQTAFQVAFEQLGQFGQMLMSDVTTSKDHTGRTNNIYHNACVCETWQALFQMLGISCDKQIKIFVLLKLTFTNSTNPFAYTTRLY